MACLQIASFPSALKSFMLEYGCAFFYLIVIEVHRDYLQSEVVKWRLHIVVYIWAKCLNSHYNLWKSN